MKRSSNGVWLKAVRVKRKTLDLTESPAVLAGSIEAAKFNQIRPL